MATSKTLTPTNVTIQIPAFTDQPDQRVNSNCIDKEADAIDRAVKQVLQDGFRTGDIMSDGCTRVGCSQMGDLLAERIK